MRQGGAWMVLGLTAAAAAASALARGARNQDLVSVSPALVQLWGHVHLSRKFLGERAEFKPRVPADGFEDHEGYIIEDRSTPRISVAKTLQDAARGLHAQSPEGYEAYAVSKKVPVSRLESLWGDCPSSPGNPYGESFSWSEYAENEEIDPDDDGEREFRVTNCVPDLMKTRERWIEAPVEMWWIGRVGGDGRLRLPRAQLLRLLDVLKVSDVPKALRALGVRDVASLSG